MLRLIYFRPKKYSRKSLGDPYGLGIFFELFIDFLLTYINFCWTIYLKEILNCLIDQVIHTGSIFRFSSIVFTLILIYHKNSSYRR